MEGSIGSRLILGSPELPEGADRSGHAVQAIVTRCFQSQMWAHPSRSMAGLHGVQLSSQLYRRTDLLLLENGVLVECFCAVAVTVRLVYPIYIKCMVCCAAGGEATNPRSGLASAQVCQLG